MTFNTSLLQYCIDISEYKNFSKVAQLHYITPQALSQQVKNLEESLGVRLFVRTNRSVSVTAAGEEFIKEARLALQHVEQAVKNAKACREDAAMRLSIGYNGPTSRENVLRQLKKYQRTFPDTDIRICSSSFDDIVQRFRAKEEFDIIAVGDFSSFDPAVYDCKRFESGVICAVFGREHPLAGRSIVTRDELLREQFIGLDIKVDSNGQPGTGKRKDRIRRILGDLPRRVKYLENTESVNIMVAAGNGYTLLNSNLERGFDERIYSFVPIEGVIETHPNWFVWKKSITNPALRAFLSLLD